MLVVDIFHSTEFYVIMAVLAAAILGLCVRPSQKGPARSFFYASTLVTTSGEESQAVSLHCLDNGSVELIRTGLRGHVDTAGAVSLAVTVIGFDVRIMEKITPTGPQAGDPVDVAIFIMDCFAPEHYHLHYTASDGSVCAFTLHNRPGIRVSRPVSV